MAQAAIDSLTELAELAALRNDNAQLRAALGRIQKRAQIARRLLRLMVGLAMLSLAIVLNETAPIALYVTDQTAITLEMFRGMLLLGGGGVLFVPTQHPLVLFYLTLPLFIYAAGGVGGALGGRFQDWTGIVYLLLCGMFVVLYWRDS